MGENFKLDFVGVAAPRSGTTWISRCLGEHPDICVPINKEPHFFLYDSRYHQLASYLARLFRHYNNERLKGEWSNMYLYSKAAAARIKEHNPDIKILMCLRDPVERAYSQYLNRKYNASIMPFYSFKHIIDREDKYQYLSWGVYAKHIKHYQTLFPEKNIYIMFYEDWVENPKQEMQKLLSFLGVNSSFVPPSLNIKINDRGKNKYHSLYLQSILNKLTLLYRESPMRNILGPLRIRDLLRFLERINKRKTLVPFDKPPLDPAVRRRLNVFFADEIRDLENLVGRKLDFWKK